MRDPYEVLGVSRNAGLDQIKTAYRNLAKKYHPDNFADSPLQEVANEKMQEINEAYDAIISGKANSQYQYESGGYYSNSSSQYSYSGNDYTYVKNLIDNRRLDDAEILLENMSQASRDSQWYYLKGRINYERGWIDQAYTYFSTAYSMEPNNAEYRYAYENLQNRQNGGFRGTNRDSSDCSMSKVCCSLLCADSCCECMGGDMIPCC